MEPESNQASKSNHQLAEITYQMPPWAYNLIHFESGKFYKEESPNFLKKKKVEKGKCNRLRGLRDKSTKYNVYTLFG